MALNRSIERDYDINYHTRAARKAMQECLDNLDALIAIDYHPYPTKIVLEEMWQTWKDKLDATLY